MKSYTAGKNEADMRLSRFVEGVTVNLPANLMHKSFRNKRIKINKKRAEPNYRLQEGDLIELYINDEFFAQEKTAAKPVKPITLNIVYEDENIAIINKPAHMLCHSDKTGDKNLAQSFVDYLEYKGEFAKNDEAVFTPALCNRLDRGTQGLVIGGKNYAAVRDMNEIIKNNLVAKTYLCIGVGSVKKGRYTAFLKHFEKINKSEIMPYEADGYKKIITDINPLKNKGPFTLFEIGLITGRTHQIRAHLSHLGAPLLGDIKYGNKKLNERCKTRTQALCASKLQFKQICTESSLAYLSNKCFEISAPQVIKQFEML